MNYTYICPCHFGIESVLAGEIRRMGGENVKVTDGKVEFDGDLYLLARANLCLRTAERVLLKLGEFKAESYDQLFEQTRNLPWESWIGKLDAFPVKGYSLSSKLRSVPDCQSIIKKAIVERLKTCYHLNWFSESGSLHRVQFSLLKDTACLCLDTSGEGLHKRGYRKNASVAPIRETLACGIIDLAHVKRHSILYDPFCGSGTFLIESACKAMNIAPGLHRRFAAEQWSQIDACLWSEERSKALSEIKRDVEFEGYGSDIDAACIALSRENASKANVESKLTFQRADISEFHLEKKGGIVICNPPYGERLMEQTQAEKLIRRMGQKFVKTDDWSYYIISPQPNFEELFGRKADKRRKLYNGMLKCQLYMYYKS